MLKAATMLAVVAVVTIMTRTVYLGMVNEARHSSFIASGRFLTEEYNQTNK
jgi:hypothetical protein